MTSTSGDSEDARFSTRVRLSSHRRHDGFQRVAGSRPRDVVSSDPWECAQQRVLRSRFTARPISHVRKACVVRACVTVHRGYSPRVEVRECMYFVHAS